MDLVDPPEFHPDSLYMASLDYIERLYRAGLSQAEFDRLRPFPEAVKEVLASHFKTIRDHIPDHLPQFAKFIVEVRQHHRTAQDTQRDIALWSEIERVVSHTPIPFLYEGFEGPELFVERPGRGKPINRVAMRDIEMEARRLRDATPNGKKLSKRQAALQAARHGQRVYGLTREETKNAAEHARKAIAKPSDQT